MSERAWGRLFLAVAVALVFWLVIALTGCGAPGPVPTATPNVAATAQTLATAVAAFALPATPTSRPSPTPGVGNRQQPVPKGQAFTYRTATAVYSVQVLEVERDANGTMKRAGSVVNREPPPGQAYVLVRIRMRYLEGPQDQPLKTSDASFHLVADNRAWNEPYTSLPPDPYFTEKRIFPGATVEGWLSGRWLPRELQSQALMVFDDVYYELP